MSSDAPSPVYYQPPASHERVVKKMMVGLAIFFTLLFIALSSLVYFADRLVVYLPFSAEKQFVRPYESLAKRFSNQENNLQEETIQQYLDKLTEELVLAAQLDEDFSVEVHYLNSDAINAFATLGGHIFVCRGLIEAMPDENSLAMVIAHEIAHIKYRDPAVGMTRGLALSLIYSFATGDYNQTNLAGYGSEMGLLYFSREQEKTADLDALVSLNKKYGHVGGFAQVFESIVEEEDNQDESAPNWFASHPQLQQRIAYLTEQVSLNQWSENTRVSYPKAIIEALLRESPDEKE